MFSLLLRAGVSRRFELAGASRRLRLSVLAFFGNFEPSRASIGHDVTASISPQSYPHPAHARVPQFFGCCRGIRDLL